LGFQAILPDVYSQLTGTLHPARYHSIVMAIKGCDNLWNEKLREGMWKETDVSLFGYGGRKRLHSLLDSRRKNLQKGFSSTPRPQADFVPEGHVIFSLAVIVCLSICCALAQLSVRMIVTPQL
jgi:hypothetical protein